MTTIALLKELKDKISSLEETESDLDQFIGYSLKLLAFAYDFVSLSKSEKCDRVRKLKSVDLLGDDVIAMDGDVEALKTVLKSIKLNAENLEKHFEELSIVAPTVFKQLCENTADMDNDSETEEDTVDVEASSSSVETSSTTTVQKGEPPKINLVHNLQFDVIGRTAKGVAVAKPSVATKKVINTFSGTTTLRAVKKHCEPEVRFSNQNTVVKCLKSMMSFILRNWFFLFLLMLCTVCILLQYGFIMHIWSTIQEDCHTYNIFKSYLDDPRVPYAFRSTCAIVA